MTESTKAVAPPLQQLVQALQAMDDPAQSDQQQPSPQVRAVLSLMDQVTLDELGLTQECLSRLPYGQSMTIAETARFDVAVFMLPRGFALPLHDHPHMMVCSTLLAGEAAVRGFSAQAVNDQGDVQATVALEARKSQSDGAWLLTAQLGNFHEITPMTDCVMLDVLLPPYNEASRPCTFYHAKKLDPATGTANNNNNNNNNNNTGSSSYLLRPLPPQIMQRIRLPLNVPFRGTKPVLRPLSC
jgi:hypothetical protein